MGISYFEAISKMLLEITVLEKIPVLHYTKTFHEMAFTQNE